MTDASDFVVERIKHRYLVDTGEFDATFVQKLFEQILCSSSKTGILKERVSSTIKLGYRVCINEGCGDTRPVCKKVAVK